MAIAIGTRSSPWTEDDLLELPEDGQRYEVVDGTLVVSPPPSGPHQLASFRIARLLDEAAPPELIVVEALGVRVHGGALIPDVMVAERDAVMAATGGFVPADHVRLVVEIVSPASRTMDRTSKPAAYAEAGIPWYWWVELDKTPAICAFRLDSRGVYEEFGSSRPGLPRGCPVPCGTWVAAPGS